MRKLFLLVCVVFVGYYGVSLWPMDETGTVAGWLPMALMITTLVLGLAHMPTALGVTLVLVLLTGNLQFLCQIARIDRNGAMATTLLGLQYPAEPLLLGLLAAWILLRFFGNPELDYEYHKATAVRALHFPVGIVCFTAVLASLHAVIFSQNIFTVSFGEGVRDAVLKWPFSVLQGGGGIAPVRAVVRLIECVAVYTIITNELRTMRHVRLFAGLLVLLGVVVSVLGFVPVCSGCYPSGLSQYTKEMQSTFPDPNACAVFLLALLPLCGAMIVKGRFLAVLGATCAVVFLLAIVLTGTKMATLVAVAIFVAVAVAAVVQALRQKSYWKLGIVGSLLLVVGVGYLTACVIHARTKESRWAGLVVERVNGTAAAFFGIKLTPQELNRRTNYKLGDYATAINMVNPVATGQESRIISGIGYGNFSSKYEQNRVAWASKRRDGASNMFLHTLAETGIVGALALALTVLCAVVWTLMAARTIKAPVFASSVAVALMMLVLGCMTENAFLRPQIQVVFWTLVALCMVLTSLVSQTSSVRDFYLLKFVTMVLLLGSWTFCVYPRLKGGQAEATEIKEVAQRSAEITGYPLTDLLKSFETSRDFQFRSLGSRRYMGKEALVLTKVTGPVLDVVLDVYLPKISRTTRQIVRLSMNETILDDIVFTNGAPCPGMPLMLESRHVEIDISRYTNLVRYVHDARFAVIRLTAESTFVPGDHGTQLKQSGLMFDMGAFVAPLTWKALPADTEGAAVPPAATVAVPTDPSPVPPRPVDTNSVRKGGLPAAPPALPPAPPGPATNSAGTAALPAAER